MGIDLQLWRCRIGNFFSTHSNLKKCMHGYVIGSIFCHGLRFVLLFLVCASLYTDQLTHTNRPIEANHNMVCTEYRAIEMTESRNKWTTSIYSLLTISRSGDIEMNPGPTGVAGQDEPRKTRQNRSSTDDSLPNQPSLKDVMSEIRDFRKDVSTKLADLKTDVAAQKEELTSLKQRVNELQHDNNILVQRLDSLEGQSRRNNIIVRGVPETPDETWDQCETLLKETLSSKLGMEGDRVNDIPRERVHRLPRPAHLDHRKPRDIICKCAFYKDKDNIMKSARSKKPEGVFFMEDLTKTVKSVRYKLKDKLRKCKEAGFKSYYSHDKLIVVDGDRKRNAYTYDTVNDHIKCLY